MNANLYNLAKNVGALLKKRKLSVVVAESCTGGLLAASITAISGSSAYFERGFVVYSNEAKKELLGVKQQILRTFGAVSEETACEMAKGALRCSHAQIGIAITGIAGPTGGSKAKPKGTVCFDFIYKGVGAESFTVHFDGDRRDVREQAVEFALEWLLESSLL